jgi:hypothetical protein
MYAHNEAVGVGHQCWPPSEVAMEILPSCGYIPARWKFRTMHRDDYGAAVKTIATKNLTLEAVDNSN